MISYTKRSQLGLNQEQLNNRHSQILANHKELENKYFEYNFTQESTRSQPLNKNIRL